MQISFFYDSHELEILSIRCIEINYNYNNYN